MSLAKKLVAARKKKGLTQEELAELTNVTVRTIQRIESGETTPRSFTLKAIASALDISFEEINPSNTVEISASTEMQMVQTGDLTDSKEFIQTLCLSCFSYLVIPYVHFLIPVYLLKKSAHHHNSVKQFGRRLIRQQVMWVIGMNMALLLTVAYNVVLASKNNQLKPISYFLTVSVFYLLNAGVIISKLLGIKKATTS